MKVPRISVHADFDDEASLGEINSSSFGYGIHQAWIYAAMFGAGSLFGVETIPTGTSLSLVYLVSIVANFVALFVCALVDEKVTKLFVNHYPIILPMILMTGGSLLMLLCDISSPFAAPLSILAGITTGVGSACYLLYWGIAFSRLNLVSVVMNTVLSFVYAILFYGLATAIPAPYAGIAISVLPVVEGIIIKRHSPRLYQEKRKLPFFNSLPVNKGRFFVSFAIPMLFFGVALGYIRSVGMVDVFLSFGQSSNALPLAFADFLAILVLVLGIVIMRSELVEDFLRPVLPLIASAMVFVPLCTQTSAAYPGMFVLAGYICFEAVLWVIFAAFSQHYRLSPILVFGFGRSSLGFGAVAGLAVTSSINHFYNVLPYENVTFVIIALICIIAGQATLPRERDLRRLVLHGKIGTDSLADLLNLREDDLETQGRAGQGATTRGDAISNSAGLGSTGAEDTEAGSTEASDASSGKAEPSDTKDIKPTEAHTPFDVRQKDAEENDAQPATSQAQAQDEMPQSKVTAPGPSENTPSDSASPAPGAPAAIAQAPATRASVTHAPASNASSVPASATSHAHNTYLRSRASTTSQAPDSAQEPEEPRMGFFRRKCEVISNQYLLSARETEVLFYLAKGYNSAYLQEKLYISEGTAKTHIRHIYGKTNVHSQQELMRLVNEVRV